MAWLLTFETKTAVNLGKEKRSDRGERDKGEMDGREGLG